MYRIKFWIDFGFRFWFGSRPNICFFFFFSYFDTILCWNKFIFILKGWTYFNSKFGGLILFNSHYYSCFLIILFYYYWKNSYSKTKVPWVVCFSLFELWSVCLELKMGEGDWILSRLLAENEISRLLCSSTRLLWRSRSCSWSFSLQLSYSAPCCGRSDSWGAGASASVTATSATLSLLAFLFALRVTGWPAVCARGGASAEGDSGEGDRTVGEDEVLLGLLFSTIFTLDSLTDFVCFLGLASELLLARATSCSLSS